eukprot:5381217-Prymnesium_polylepis.1
MTGLRLAIALHRKGVHCVLTTESDRAAEILLMAFDMTLRSIEEARVKSAPPPPPGDSPPETCRPRPAIDTMIVDPGDIGSIQQFLEAFKQKHKAFDI